VAPAAGWLVGNWVFVKLGLRAYCYNWDTGTGTLIVEVVDLLLYRVVVSRNIFAANCHGAAQMSNVREPIHTFDQ
jgi:hypothetical protein